MGLLMISDSLAESTALAGSLRNERPVIFPTGAGDTSSGGDRTGEAQ
jgi:hypothetical protein